MSSGKAWTTKEIEFLRANVETMSHEEMASHLPNRTRLAIKCRCLKMGFVRPKFRWNAGKIVQLKNRYADTKTAILATEFGCSTYTIYNKAYSLGIQKSEEFLKSDECGRLTKNNNLAGATFRFTKGRKPWNKGKPMPVVGRMAETQFSKGHRPHNAAQVGYESTIQGYVKVKIAEPNVWEFKHRLIWKQNHGEIPKGSAVVFKANNRQNFAIENFELLSRKELRIKNSIGNLPPEIKDAYRTLGRLTRAINKKEGKYAKK